MQQNVPLNTFHVDSLFTKKINMNARHLKWSEEPNVFADPNMHTDRANHGVALTVMKVIAFLMFAVDLTIPTSNQHFH